MESYWWPDGDEGNGGVRGWSPGMWVDAQLAHAYALARLVRPAHRHTAVQAGGHIGIFPIVFAQFFTSVLTFEPDPQNAKCLLKNTSEHANGQWIRVSPLALGPYEMRRMNVVHNEANSGASYLVDGEGRVDMGTVALDTFTLQSCDLLQLDVEGFERFALEGAVDTIQRFRPVIVLEHNQCAARYGCNKMETDRWLAERGYVERRELKIGNDHVYMHKEEN